MNMSVCIGSGCFLCLGILGVNMYVITMKYNRMYIFDSCGNRYNIKNSTYLFLPWMSKKATRRLIALTPEIDGNGRTICHVCSIPNSLVILVERGCLRRISEMPLLPLRG
jgi:hypothetical protein